MKWVIRILQSTDSADDNGMVIVMYMWCLTVNVSRAVMLSKDRGDCRMTQKTLFISGKSYEPV